MALQNQVMDALKAAMKAKDAVAVELLRAIKSAILHQHSEAGSKELSSTDEIKLLQKLVKQRKDSAALYNEQGRLDLADPELAQAKVIEQFLPEPLSEAELDELIKAVITELSAEGMKDMGRVVGEVNSRAAGRAEGKVIAQKVKDHLTN